MIEKTGTSVGIGVGLFCQGFNGSTAASEALVFGGKTVDTQLTELTEEWKGNNWLTEARLTVS